MEQFHTMDWIILVILVVSVLTGLIRGFVKEALGIGIWISAFTLAYYGHHTAFILLKNHVHNVALRHGFAFIIIFGGVLILGVILNVFMGQLIKHSGFGGTDRVLGTVFGFARGVVVISMLIAVLKITLFSMDDFSEQSILYKKFEPLVVRWIHFAPNVLDKIHVIKELAVAKWDIAS